MKRKKYKLLWYLIHFSVIYCSGLPAYQRSSRHWCCTDCGRMGRLAPWMTLWRNMWRTLPSKTRLGRPETPSWSTWQTAWFSWTAERFRFAPHPSPCAGWPVSSQVHSGQWNTSQHLGMSVSVPGVGGENENSQQILGTRFWTGIAASQTCSIHQRKQAKLLECWGMLVHFTLVEGVSVHLYLLKGQERQSKAQLRLAPLSQSVSHLSRMNLICCCFQACACNVM